MDNRALLVVSAGQRLVRVDMTWPLYEAADAEVSWSKCVSCTSGKGGSPSGRGATCLFLPNLSPFHSNVLKREGAKLMRMNRGKERTHKWTIKNKEDPPTAEDTETCDTHSASQMQAA